MRDLFAMLTGCTRGLVALLCCAGLLFSLSAKPLAAAIPQAPGGPILLITNSSDPFSDYYQEILFNEGLNAFAVRPLGQVTATVLDGHDLAILAPVPLNAAQVTMFSNWVNGGGRLIAMRPDKQLAGLLGLADASSTLSDAYVLIDTTKTPGQGLVNDTIQFHGTADRYTLAGAESLATLYANASTPTANPALTVRTLGAGQAAAFTYDLARSVVYTRQGNPAWAAQERDGFSPIRSDDKFFGNATGDPQPDWINLNKVAIPQADEHQRLLANLILKMNVARKPLPRFWYFPRGEKAVVLMTGDDHGNNGTEGRFHRFQQLSPPGCSVANWECVRGTSYVYPATPMTPATASAFDAAGFEISLHLTTFCGDFTPASLRSDYAQQLGQFASEFPSLPAPITQRHHCIVWSDWVTGAVVQLENGIRLDTSYYYWPPSWVQNRPGFFNGSGMPMRFADFNGTRLDAYLTESQMTDESGQDYPFTIDTLLNRALGAEGYYGVFTVNAHTDWNDDASGPYPISDAVVSSALARGVPIITARQLLTWLDGRNESSFGALAMSGPTLTFSIAAHAAAVGLQAMLPTQSAQGALSALVRNGNPVGFTTQTIKGVQYALFPATAGSYAATYGSGTDTTPPTVTARAPAPGETGVAVAANVTVTFSEAMDPATINGTTIELRAPGGALVPATVGYDAANLRATLDPNTNLAASTTYTATVICCAAGVKDVAGNALAANSSWTFSTIAADATPPTIASRSPAAGAADVPPGTVVTATFSEAMDPATINGTTFELRQGSTLVPATVSYDAANLRATLDPSNDLAASTTYTATVKGGASGVKDVAGNALAADSSWSFTTAAGPSCPCTIWPSSATPTLVQDPDTASVELGVKFRANTGGFITGIRFYKGANNTGPHVGTLWSAGGAQLAQVTFTNETGSGWQQANFGAPVAITANTVYVASYHTNVGRYSVNENYFASAVVNGPLTALSNSESINGVYAYSAAPSFPTSTFNASNYWVDVVFDISTGPDTQPPTVTARTPVDGATNVFPGTTVSATFSEPMDPATVNGNTVELRTPTSTLVPASVTYNTGTRVATLTPNATLNGSTTYTATVKGGTSGVKDLAGNALAANNSWSFTTATTPTSIAEENALPGNPPSEWDISGSGDSSIQGFTTVISYDRGEIVDFKVDSAASYRLEIYRMGYYAGNGARRIDTVTGRPASNQPTCSLTSSTGLVDCGNWSVAASWQVPTQAVSGIYFAKAIREDTGGASHIFFIVRNDASHSDILFQTSDTTWQAYNQYGGRSLYTGGPGTNPSRAYKVSYNRPFTTRGDVPEGHDWVMYGEYPMVRWLERNGYDVTYTTGVDSDRRGNLIRNHKLFLSVGHDEYWSAGQRTNVEAARAAGVHLSFFSGNSIYWKTRWEPDGSATATACQANPLTAGCYRTLVSYKESHNSAKIDQSPAGINIWTGLWRDSRSYAVSTGGNNPENVLMGTIFTVNDTPEVSLNVPFAYAGLRFWRGTSVANLSSGQTATLGQQIIGYEFDEDLDNGRRPAGLFHLSQTLYPNAPRIQDETGNSYAAEDVLHHLTLYRAASGALVFGTGTVQWAWGLDGQHDGPSTPENPAMQQATVNMFADMGVQPQTLQTGLVPAVASNDTTAPSTVITNPTAGASLQPGVPVTISGTASDVGGIVAAVEVSVDGGGTWAPAAGRTAWSLPWTPAGSGNVTIRARSVDDSGNLQSPATAVTVSIGSTDTTPPTVTATVPAAGAIGVAVGTAVTATFSEPMNATTISTSTVELRTPANTLVPATVGYDAANVRATLTPSSALAASTTYTAKVISGAGGVKDVAGNALVADFTWSFTTAAAPVDTTPPTVTATVPTAGATGVAVGTAVTATFSEPMNATTISTSTVELRTPANTLVPATVGYDAANVRATLTPSSALAASTTYTAKVISGAGGVKDVAGNALVADFTWSFTTAAPAPVTFTSIASQDGYVIESGETTNAGGSATSNGSGTRALRVGDTNNDRQQKSIVSFDTSGIPDAATIVSATLRLRRGTVTGTNPFTTHGECRVDVAPPLGFGGSTALAASDFQATPAVVGVAVLGDAASNGAWSEGLFNASGLDAINKTGTTQFRVYFDLDDNDDGGADEMDYYSGEAAAANRPQLVVTYQ